MRQKTFVFFVAFVVLTGLFYYFAVIHEKKNAATCENIERPNPNNEPQLKERNSDIAKGVIIPKPSNQILVQTKTDPPIFLYTLPNDEVSNYIRRDGVFDTRLYGIVKKLFGEVCKKKGKRRPIIVDVGANLGLYGLYGAACGCKAIMIEANPFLSSMIRSSIILNDFSNENAILYSVAIDTKEGEIGYNHVSDHNYGQGNLRDSGPKQFKVRTRPLADILDEQLEPDEVIEFMKIDVEGFEPNVIFSMEKYLRAKRVKYIDLEWNPGWYKDDMGLKMLTLLDDCGYIIERLKREDFEKAAKSKALTQDLTVHL